MTNEEYEELQKNIQNLEKDIFDQSFKNLKKSLEIITKLINTNDSKKNTLLLVWR